MTTIYQGSRLGKIKYIKVWTEGNELVREWGTFTKSIEEDGSKPQTTRKQCEGKNIGKANETTPEEQAVLEKHALLDRKKNEGYTEDLHDAMGTSKATQNCKDAIKSHGNHIVMPPLPLPKSFCPCKPISKAPTSIIESPYTYAQRKVNGHCILLAKSGDTKQVYSRRIEDISWLANVDPEVLAIITNMPDKSLLICEYVFTGNDGKERPREVAKIIRKKDEAGTKERYNAAIKKGHLNCVVLDALFWDNKYLGNESHVKRYNTLSNLLSQYMLDNNSGWRSNEEDAKKKGWEGFVLRQDNDSSKISFTLDGKAYRQGSYKYKFLQTDDFVVTSAEKGKAGKHMGLYAQFYIAQYMSPAENQRRVLTPFGKCGPGKLSHEELKHLTDEIDKGNRKFPFVIEIEYQSRQEDSGKLEFPQFCLIRDDKSISECLCEEIYPEAEVPEV